MQDFDDFTCCNGLTFAQKNARVELINTVLQALVGQLIKNIYPLELKPYNLRLIDFEALVAWTAKFKKNLSQDRASICL